MKNKKFEAACKKLGRSAALPDVSMLPKEVGEYLVNHYILVTLIEAKNKGKRVDFTDDGYYKYYPYGYAVKDKKHPSGFGFSVSYYAYSLTTTGVGSRLCFFNSKDALNAFEEFKDEYIKNQLM